MDRDGNGASRGVLWTVIGIIVLILTAWLIWSWADNASNEIDTIENNTTTEQVTPEAGTPGTDGQDAADQPDGTDNQPGTDAQDGTTDQTNPTDQVTPEPGTTQQ